MSDDRTPVEELVEAHRELVEDLAKSQLPIADDAQRALDLLDSEGEEE